MASLDTTVSYTVDDSDTENGAISFTPASIRNGLVTCYGNEQAPGTMLPAGSRATATFSVRSGKPADLINGGARVKRKTTIKLRLPVEVPALVSGSVADVIDYVDAELVIASPVETGVDVLRTAQKFFSRNNGILETNWVEEMIENGYEPY